MRGGGGRVSHARLSLNQYPFLMFRLFQIAPRLDALFVLTVRRENGVRVRVKASNDIRIGVRASFSILERRDSRALVN